MLERIRFKLRKMRQERNYSLAFVYEYTKINVKRIERGETAPTILTITRLCSCYGSSIRAFFETLDQEGDVESRC